MGVSIWGAVHQMDRWALSGADVQTPWHGVLETVWLHCDEAQQVGIASKHTKHGLRDRKSNKTTV